MAGLYIHIPFCKSRCIYCSFYSTTCHELMEPYVDALLLEMTMRAQQESPLIDTVYLGGGTPSQLPTGLLRKLFQHIYKVYDVSDSAEITIECNPDDVSRRAGDPAREPRQHGGTDFLRRTAALLAPQAHRTAGGRSRRPAAS